MTKTGLVVGTPEYMSPEQLSGDKLDGRSDIYSLALVAFNMLTGKLPFPGQTTQESMIMRLTDRPRRCRDAPGSLLAAGAAGGDGPRAVAARVGSLSARERVRRGDRRGGGGDARTSRRRARRR